MGRRRSKRACVSNICRFCVGRAGKVGPRLSFFPRSFDGACLLCVYTALVRLLAEIVCYRSLFKQLFPLLFEHDRAREFWLWKMGGNRAGARERTSAKGAS